MPSPIGHAMAGAMVAWIAEIQSSRSTSSGGHEPAASPARRPSSRAKHARPMSSDALLAAARPGTWSGRVSTLSAAVLTPLTIACAVLAISPDFDSLFHTHRTYSHSLGAAGIVWLLVALVAWRLRLPVVRVATVCAAAYATHVLLDWLGRDDSVAGGLMVLWPLSTHFYSSGANLFLELVPRPRLGLTRLVLANGHAVARELLILAPPFLAVLILRVRSLRRAGSGPLRSHGTRPSLKYRADARQVGAGAGDRR